MYVLAEDPVTGGFRQLQRWHRLLHLCRELWQTAEIRSQGALVSRQEVQDVVDHLRSRTPRVPIRGDRGVRHEQAAPDPTGILQKDQEHRNHELLTNTKKVGVYFHV